MLPQFFVLMVTAIVTTIIWTFPAFTHEIQEIKGNQNGLKVKRDKQWETLKKGEQVKSNDRVQLEKGTRAWILCNRQKNRKELDPGTSGIAEYCGDGTVTRPSLVYRRGGNNSAIPFVISPRFTLLQTKTPTFRWNQVAGANTYTVRLMNSRGEVWKQPRTTTETYLPYPYPEENPLDEGVRYWLVVEANNSISSNKEWCPYPFGFEVPPDQSNNLEAQLNDITNSSLSSEEKSLYRAEVYKDRKLFSDAIRILETLGDNGSAMIFLELGELYAKIGLLKFAEDRYSTSIQKAKFDLIKSSRDMYTAAQNQRILAKAQGGLALTKLLLDDQKVAEGLREQAVTIYKALEDTESITELIVEFRDLTGRLEKLRQEGCPDSTKPIIPDSP